jgi:hypothetical protein
MELRQRSFMRVWICMGEGEEGKIARGGRKHRYGRVCCDMILV